MAVPRLLGISGRKRSGKSLAADTLVTEFRRTFEWQLARPIKTFATQALGLTYAQVDGRDPEFDREAILPEWGMSARQFMQRFGTEVGRAIHPDIWVRMLMRDCRDFGGLADVMVVSDVRFANEAEAIQARGGVVWRITRSDDNHPTDGHPSEDLSDVPFDLEIHNGGTIEEFRDSVALLGTQQWVAWGLAVRIGG